METILLGGGCFWCTEALFKMLRGVTCVTPGYAGGTKPDPSYEEVCAGSTGHAEVVKVAFDPKIIPLDDLLDIFFHLHDPTSLNRQGNDTGTQYRSIILYTNNIQKDLAQHMIDDFNTKNEFGSKILTTLEPVTEFYPAEQYHMDYYRRNSYLPYCQAIISPKLQFLKEKYLLYTTPE